jgi:hypothetical protein
MINKVSFILLSDNKGTKPPPKKSKKAGSALFGEGMRCKSCRLLHVYYENKYSDK